MSFAEYDAALRISLAILYGAIIGVERQWHHKNAGIKTTTLVSLGAAGFAILSATGFGPSNNPGQFASAVITGIGFLGAGVIIHRGPNVQGINTAATLWASASMGIALGAGHVKLGSALFAAVIFIQFAARALSRTVARYAAQYGPPEDFELRVACDASAIETLDGAWKEFIRDKSIRSQHRTLSRKEWVIEFSSPKTHMPELEAFERTLLALPGVQRVESQRIEPGSEPE